MSGLYGAGQFGEDKDGYLLPPPAVAGLRWSEAPHEHWAGGSGGPRADPYEDSSGGLKYTMQGAQHFIPHPSHATPSHNDAPMQQQWQANGQYHYAQVR